MAVFAGVDERSHAAAAVDSPPTIASARAAAKAIAETVPGVQKIGLFGSVARGEATSRSDIDLLVVFRDMNYQDRKRLAGRCRSVARGAGHEVSVVATDAHEWRLRSELSTTFERAIAAELQELYASDQPAPAVCCDKEAQMDRPISGGNGSSVAGRKVGHFQRSLPPSPISEQNALLARTSRTRNRQSAPTVIPRLIVPMFSGRRSLRVALRLESSQSAPVLIPGWPRRGGAAARRKEKPRQCTTDE